MSVTATPNPYQNELQQVGQALHFLPKITNNGNGGGGGNRMMNDEASTSMNVNVRTLSRVGSIGSNHDRYRYNINNNNNINESSMSFNK
jgi:hypothetical protein